jgi:hypothetical protein
MSGDRVVRVYAAMDAFEGHLMKGRLEAEGIQVLLKGEGEGPYRMGPVYLWVDEADEPRARAVVDAVGSGAFAVDDADVEAAALDGENDDAKG